MSKRTMVQVVYRDHERKQKAKLQTHFVTAHDHYSAWRQVVDIYDAVVVLDVFISQDRNKFGGVLQNRYEAHDIVN